MQAQLLSFLRSRQQQRCPGKTFALQRNECLRTERPRSVSGVLGEQLCDQSKQRRASASESACTSDCCCR